MILSCFFFLVRMTSLADASDFVLSTYRLFSQGFNLTSGVAYYGKNTYEPLICIGQKLNKRLLFKSIQVANSSTIYPTRRQSSFFTDYKACSDFEFLLRHRKSLHCSFLPYAASFLRAGVLFCSHFKPIKESFLIKLRHLNFNIIDIILSFVSFVYAASVFFASSIRNFIECTGE